MGIGAFASLPAGLGGTNFAVDFGGSFSDKFFVSSVSYGT
jgi:hypothetical protein